MPIKIYQGVQDISQDDKFKVIVAKDVLMEITEIELADETKQPNTIKLTFRIIDGAHKGRFVWDSVSFDPSSQFSWKYRSLRAAAGVPYDPEESPEIDIEELLLHQVVLVNLGSRDGSKGGIFQSITYKKMNDNLLEKISSTNALDLPDKPSVQLSFSEDDVPLPPRPGTTTPLAPEPKGIPNNIPNIDAKKLDDLFDLDKESTTIDFGTDDPLKVNTDKVVVKKESDNKPGPTPTPPAKLSDDDWS
jgi:hypothetical protein